MQKVMILVESITQEQRNNHYNSSTLTESGSDSEAVSEENLAPSLMEKDLCKTIIFCFFQNISPSILDCRLDDYCKLNNLCSEMYAQSNENLFIHIITPHMFL